jgi:hypothetical protein
MDIRQSRFYHFGLFRFDRLIATAAIVGLLSTLTSCVSFPLPPTGDDAGKWGFVDVRIQYRPNIETLLSAWKQNPDLPETSTLNQKP